MPFLWQAAVVYTNVIHSGGKKDKLNRLERDLTAEKGCSVQSGRSPWGAVVCRTMREKTAQEAHDGNRKDSSGPGMHAGVPRQGQTKPGPPVQGSYSDSFLRKLGSQ